MAKEVKPLKDQPKAEPVASPTPEQADETSTEAAAKDSRVAKLRSKVPLKADHWHRFTAWYKVHKKLSIPLTVLCVVLILEVIPFTRYQIAGLFLKKTFSMQVLDAETHDPVSGAAVTIGSKTSLTDATGKAKLAAVPVGNHTAQITKKYYKDGQAKILVPILSQKTVPSTSITATGRQVKINVTNLISKANLSGVNIKVAGTTAKTDTSGNATVVLPVGQATQKATLSLSGYNDAAVEIKVSDTTVQQNNFSLTPAGKVYFLSKLSGKIDVVKTNLDGSGRQTVLAGTGKEEDTGTVLLASRDWKYLALLARRDGSLPALYLIDTSTDNMTNIDTGNASFNPVGWSDDNFVYTVNRNNILAWQPGAEVLKSYNAPAKKLNQLDQTAASGTNGIDYANESYGNVYLEGKNVVYEKTWQAATYYTPDALVDKQAGIYSVAATGGSSQPLKNFGYDIGKSTYIGSVPYEAQQIYYQVTEKDAISYYAYSGGRITAKTDIADDYNNYYQNGAVTYLQSPTSNETFWAEARDGKNTLFLGDQNGDNGKQLAALSDYFSYGWYTDDYLLVSKDSSELYIMPKAVLTPTLTPIKISDYHKPKQSFSGYGGGYGGI